MSNYDLIVVGAGAAGTAAALSAAEASDEAGHHLRIAILERADETGWGGNSRWTPANLKMLDENHLPPSFEDDMIRDTRGRADREYVRRLTVEAVDTIHWVGSKGVKFEPKSRAMSTTVVPSGGGLEIISKLRKHAEDRGVSILFETTAWRLSIGGGSIDGIYVRTHDGKTSRLGCRALVLAGGGFEGNPEMLARYIARDAMYVRQDVPATKLHMGECINMALGIGAKPSGDFGRYHGTVVDTRGNAFRPRILAYAFGILVNVNGRRFVDEGVGEVSEYFETVARGISAQPEQRAYIIMDSSLFAIPNYKRAIETDQPPIQADTLEELAGRLRIPPGALVETVERYNGAVRDGEFDSTRPDGKGTQGIDPPKSNWASRIERPPYLSYPVEGTMQFTWGGIATDARGRVLATNDRPIPGLYAAGEMVGIYYHHYTAATSVMRALTYGRIAGFEAAQWLAEDAPS